MEETMRKTSLRFPQDLYQKIEAAAESDGLSLSEFVRVKMEGILSAESGQRAGMSGQEADNEETHFLRRQIEHLTTELSETRRAYEEGTKRHDTIVLQMTTQLDRTTLQLEDLRNPGKQSWWGRLLGGKGKANGLLQKGCHIHPGSFEQES